ncbi:hypothetical protein HMPREF9336_04118 [Segniliparus rugosus ATCC BAA-974]|uniref:Uncharacterized protein n=1 Tax=Segniliparus rugosus (strain ATCC BAA-974 / DSM 45345 / CCUG 50838 / CIP 108380 / JCM 13579 / CDC 945) TaxID=679197 RepID=U1M228_SEGRC|nr:hypothetical protein HMPREF9336_04118 [Segniliparus rugosus ATCC BAA-974]
MSGAEARPARKPPAKPDDAINRFGPRPSGD